MGLSYGDPDGHGHHGILDDDGTTVTCHECGTRRAFLGRHIRAHELTAAEYRERHGLPRGASLASAGLRATFSEQAAARVGSPTWTRFTAARDPDAAREASRAALSEGARPGTLPGRRAHAAAASRSRPRRACTVDGCDRPQRSQGLCAAHHERLRRTGDPQPNVPLRPPSGGPPLRRTPDRAAEDTAGTCTVEGCERPVQASGWCAGHYSRWYKTGEVRADVPLRPPRSGRPPRTTSPEETP